MTLANAQQRSESRTYARDSSVVFRKTAEEWGGLSNMAAGFPLKVNDLDIRTAEALYQACRFPKRPDLQLKIIDQASPMAAKMVAKPYRGLTRPDWDSVRVAVMRWCLRVKLAQNWFRFSELLLRTGDRPIVEESRRDAYWGAKPQNGTLVGVNALGRLLMELREEIGGVGPKGWGPVDPPPIDLWIAGRRVVRIKVRNSEEDRLAAMRAAEDVQAVLFPLGTPSEG